MDQLMTMREGGRAEPFQDVVPIASVQTLGDLSIIIVDMRYGNHEEFADMPRAVRFEGRVYGRTAYNSDVMQAYYRTDAMLAEAL